MSAFDDLASLEPIQQQETSSSIPTTAKTLRHFQAESDTVQNEPGADTRRREQDFDKFATLFSPSTPRASPTLISFSLPDGQDRLDLFSTTSSIPRHRRAASTSSQQSDFGAFVSVPASEDPLSAGISSFEEEGLQTPMIATPTTATASTHPVLANDTTNPPQLRSPQAHTPRPSSRSSSVSTKSKPSDPTISLSFFDKFAQDARERSSTRSGVLAELLLHQDDPLYFLKNENSASTDPKPNYLPDLPGPSGPSRSMPTFNPYDSPLNFDMNVNHDLDHDYFRTPPPNQANPSTSYKMTRGRSSNPTRSSSIPMPVATLAPPVQSPEGAVRSSTQQSPSQTAHIISNPSTSSPPLEDFNEEREDGMPEQLNRTLSYHSLSGSLSALPGKWVSTLLRAAPQSAGAKSTLESIFPDTNADPTTHIPNSLLQPQDPVSHRKSSPSPQNHRVNHAQTSAQPTFTHANVFSPPPTASTMPVTHSLSPFAPHTYMPPSGAPGFQGDNYTWDKGFSDELEAERKRDSVRAQKNEHQKAKTLPVVGRDREQQERGPEAATTSRSGWGSGFGFSFGSGRSGKTSSTSSLSPSPSTSTFRRGSLSHSASFGFEGSRDTGTGRESGWTGVRNASEEADYGLYDAGAVDSMKRPTPGVEKAGSAHSKDQEGIGAFIERKVGQVELMGRKASTTAILSPDLAGLLRPSLPALSRLPRSWTLIYSLDQDGISLNTLYTRCEAHATRRPKPGEVMINNSAMLVVMRDAEGAVFGSWLAEGLRLDKRGKGFYGGGESFLWKYTNGALKVFKCTGKNNYIALCDPEYISFGGGDGHYGLYLDETLFDGSSAPCPTFDNEPLCSPGPRKGSTITFECVGLEVWGMGS